MDPTLKKRSLTSLFSLFFQSGYAAILGLIANLVIQIYYSAETYGIYIAALAFVGLLNYISDIGLAGALIQKKELTEKDTRTVFTVQQVLILTAVTLGLLLTPQIAVFYNLPKAGEYLLQALLVSFFISSLKTIPSILLERNLQFQKIVSVQIFENTLFYVGLILCAISGFPGLTSFTICVLVRALFGLIAMYLVSPWIPKIGISKNHLQELLSFGAPLQANSFLALFKDELILLFLGKTIGFTSLGYIGWAKKWAEAPLRIIMDNSTKILFPLFSRLQDDRAKVESIINKVLFFQTMLFAPIYATLYFFMNEMTVIVPKYEKWQEALPIFAVFCASSFVISLFAPLINILYAQKKTRLSFYLMTLATATTWLLTPLLSKYMGPLGFAVTHFIVSCIYVSLVYLVKKTVKIDYGVILIKPVICSALTSFAVFFAFATLPSTLLVLVSIGILSALMYFGLLLVLKVNVVKEIREVMRVKATQQPLSHATQEERV